MNLKSNLLSLSLLASALTPAAALADHDARPRVEVHVHDASCGHVPPGQPTRHGRYELRTVRKWVDGYWTQVWVPERCKVKEHHHWRKVKCKGGHYDRRWVPGRYETVQEWVWVPYGSPHVAPTTYEPEYDSDDDDYFGSWRVGGSTQHGSTRVRFEMGGAL